jgi:hypothetical protein
MKRIFGLSAACANNELSNVKAAMNRMSMGLLLRFGTVHGVKEAVIIMVVTPAQVSSSYKQRLPR